MKILHIITRLIFGGAQENTVRTCEAQVAAGHEVHLAYGPIYGPEGSLYDRAAASGAVLHEVHTMRRAILPWHDAVCYFALRKLIAKVQPQVVHTHSSKAGILGRAAAWAEDVPAVVHTVHGLPFHERQPAVVYRGYVLAERWAAKRCHKMVGVTQAMCDAMLAEGVGEPQQFCAIPSGLDLAMFRLTDEARRQRRHATRQKLNIPQDAPVVGLLGRLDPYKGQDDLLDIASALREQLPGAKVLFVGDGWTRPTLEAKVREHGLDGMVIFAGRVPIEQVSAYLAAMDVNTLPSYQEGQPRTLVQSLLAGTPVVAYRAGGVPEMLLDGAVGRLADVGDRAALLRLIVQTFKNTGETERMLRHGREHAKQFDEQVMIDKLAALYDALLMEK